MPTIISEKIIVNGAGSKVVFDGFDFIGDGYVEVKNASEIVIKNCRVYDMNVENATKNYWLKIKNDIPVKLTIEYSFFGDNIGANGKMYNLIEPTAQLTNGSSISYNYFTANCCTHNIVNVYGCENDASIKINNNVIEATAGGIRLGIKGNKTCTVNIRDNKVLATNSEYTDEDQGLVTIQPYGKQTISFANMNLIMSGNELPCEQVVYAGYGKNDTVLTKELMPKTVVDGRVIDVTIYKW